MATVENPILRGCHPDPSICRVGDEFFLVTSSFEYFPGLPVHRSTDLVHWELVGHAVHREGQLDLSGVPSSGGLFAPTIRHHGGRFLVACTLVDGTGRSGSFVLEADDPAGPWSDPVWVIGPEGGIDPSLMIGRDGRAWWCGTRLAEPAGWPEQTEVWVREFDLAAKRLVGPERVVWNGAVAGAVWAEGPHLYEDEHGVLLLASEGGTERHHAVSTARAAAPLGEYRGNPANPVLTHRHLGTDASVANVGHADLVEDGRGGWWAVVLASRRSAGRDALMGRETWLVPVTWEDGWPVFAPGVGRLSEHVEVTWAERARDGGAARVVEYSLGGSHPDPGLSFVRTAPGVVRAAPAGGHEDRVRLEPSTASLAAPAPQAFLGFAVEEPWSRVSVTVDQPTAAGAAAGLALRHSDARHATLLVGDGTASLALHVDGEDRTAASIPVEPGAVELELELELDGFSCTGRVRADGAVRELGRLDLGPLSPGATGGFVGLRAGIAAVGTPGAAGSSAAFEALRVEYRR